MEQDPEAVGRDFKITRAILLLLVKKNKVGNKYV